MVLLAGVAGYAFALVLTLWFGAHSYQNYKKETIEHEEKQLLTMAQTIGISLVDYVKLELDSLDIYVSAMESEQEVRLNQEMTDARFVGAVAERYQKQKNHLYDAVVCFDQEGNLISQTGSMDVSSQWIPDEHTAVICGKKICMDGWYQMFISRKMVWNHKLYTMIFAMNLNEIYKQIVEPVRIGNGGYSVVKDENLSIIMHHAKDQIGMDAVFDRSKRYPQLNLTDLKEWIQMQKVQPEGYRIIRSYIWDDPELSSVQRIVAYTTISLPGEKWIVNSTLPYEELENPLQKMLYRLMGMCALFLGLLGSFLVVFTRGLVRTEGQRKEIEYLKEINAGMELLRHKEEEIQHYQRIQSIGQMSSHIAHEFNNYLTPVMVYGELLEGDESISPENKELVRGILKSAEQAAGLSRKLLDFSRVDSSVVLTPVDLTQDVRGAGKMIEQLAPQKISCQVEVPEEPCMVMGQKGMMEHILMNLSNNAFHAMEKDGGTLHISLTKKDDQALLSVADSGCGISKDAMDKIFEPFYTTKRSGKGTGLGLSVIRTIMTAVGGRIEIQSEVGKGTCFLLGFPLYQARDEKHSGKMEVDEINGRSHRKTRIVIADDDRMMLDSVSMLLKRAGYVVECYDHPAAVVSKIQNKKDYCDLIITDYSMPSMNGIELAELVRKLNPDIRLILMSGMDDVRFEWYLKNRMIDAFILKVDLAERLLGVLDENL